MKLPLLPTTGVGSFSKPDYVAEAKGHLNNDSKRATMDFIEYQKKIGVDVLVDGEFYRGDMVTDYVRALGFPLAGWTRSYDNRFWKKGVVDRPIERENPIQLDQFKYAQSLTDEPVKGILTGPTTLANWNFDSYYKDREKLVFAWADLIALEARDLEIAGAKYIQIDEPAIGERFWEEDLFREGLRRVTEGLQAYTITHVCYGEYSSVYQNLIQLPVDQIDIELSNELDLGLEYSSLLRRIREDPLTKYRDVAVGVIDVRPNVPVEDVDTVVRRIETALEVFAPTPEMLRRVWIKPDCGFRTTKNPDIAYKKMEAMMEAVKTVRKQLEPS
ncbi:methionine synthase [Candidatus Bathyarchaeota archaeon]|nr:methionine synthase [Candidatus Bathyarchaeota archaeon]